jgi:hypothetical protein
VKEAVMKRISVASLMCLTLFIAIGAAAITSESELWCSALYTLSLAALGLAIVAAIVCRGLDRAFWLGFAVFGCGYSMMVYEPTYDAFGWSRVRLNTINGGVTPHPRIVTELLLDGIYQYVVLAPAYRVGSNVQVQWGNPSSYFPAVITKIEPTQIQILWQGYPKGAEEWVVPSRVKGGEIVYFHATGHAVFTLIVGLFGGVACRTILAWGSRERTVSGPAPERSGSSTPETSNGS